MSSELLRQVTLETMPPGESFDEFVFKTNSLCNLQPRYEDGNFVGGCDYVPPLLAAASGRHGCYEYADDDSWLGQPARMSHEVIRQGAKRIAEHALLHGLPEVRIIRHGGEPLLDSAEEIEYFSRTIIEEIGRLSPNTAVRLFVQTNGIPVTAKKIEVLKRYNYRVGLSLDGDKQANDRHRKDRHGKSTYEAAVRAASLFRENDLDWGILAVIDTDNDPMTTVESLASLRPKGIKFVPPHANHSVAPPQGKMSVGEWQSKVFDWYFARPDTSIEMPIFDNYMEVLLGGAKLSTQESIGNRVTRELFILPNGFYQRVDTLKSTEQGAVATGMNLFEHSLDDVARFDTGIIARRLGSAALPEGCLRCPFLNPCGGGYYTHRFKAGARKLKTRDPIGVYVEAFQNPTVYCDPQKELLGHIAMKVERAYAMPPGTLTNPAPVEAVTSVKWYDITIPTLQDVVQIIEVLKLAQETAPERFLETNNPSEYTIAYWQERIAGKQPTDSTILVARDRYRNGMVIGHIEVRRHGLHSVYVHPDYQSHGVGRELVKKGLSVA